MLLRKLFTAIGILAVLSTLFLSVAAAPNDAPTEGRPEQPKTGEVRSPLYFKQVAEPVRPSAVARASAASSKVPYNPASIQAAYDFGAFANGGAYKAIAIVDAYGDSKLASDVATFDSTFGLPTASLIISYPAGKPRGSNSGWSLETAMDVEWAHANAPNATIYVVVSPDASFSNMLKCINSAAGLDGVVAISMSWGAPENGSGMSSVISSYDSAFKTINTTYPGIALLASSGDGRAKDGTTSLTTDYPASSPYVIGVGGTTLTLSGPGNWSSEIAWSGSGGGYSAYEQKPSSQSLANNTTSQRGVPDVSFDADPATGVYVFRSSWYQVGGTSLGAPNWAAIVADNAALNLHPLTFDYLYSTVYGVGVTSSLYGSEIHDVISGYNGGYSAVRGWDAVTGIGTPNVSNLMLGK